MKNVYTSWDLDLLADKLIEKIMKNWKTPFSSPAVVFTDPKTEQWFKLHWLKKQGAGNSILMNLKTLRIQQFLFDLVTPKVAANQNIDKLSVELLRDDIISKLTSKTPDKKYYFETLGSSEVITYLTSETSDSKINANHLYDFAQTVASLFLDYEDTRPDNLNDVLSLENWQKKLYSDVIGEQGVKIEDIKYLTLFRLVKQNKNAGTDSLTFNWKKEIPVFIFGFSGIGQIYRNILDDFSKDYQLEVFLQLSDIKESPQNQLLQKWGKFGKEQFELWTKGCILQSLSSDQSFSKNDSLLHRTQKSITEDKDFLREEYDSADTSMTLTGAPTRLREIEALHTKICQLLSQNDNTQLGDILVVAPKIQDYKTAIEQVFDQNDQFASDSDFPYIPYTIADYSGERSLTAEALTILFGILKKGYLSRSDVFALLHNYLVQTVRGISDEDVSNWADWATKLNIYRDRENHEEWQKAKNRLLLSRLTTDLVETNDCQFLPFESMTTADSDSLYKFIQIVDELKEWSSYSGKEKFTIDDISQLEKLLKKWLLLSDNIPDGLYNESLVFQNVVEEIERQILTASPDVFADCFSNALFDRSAAVTLHSANILTKGITFANFESNRILSAKYIFFIGLDSKIFPGLDNENELDLRKRNKPLPGDESIPERNKNAFLCQLMAAREGLFFSYVNKNLQKDEDFFKSSVLGDLFQTVYEPGKDKEGKENLENTEYEKQIKIDEDRPWQELFTPREFRNKHNFNSLQNSGTSETSQDSETHKQADAMQEGTALPDRISISQMKKYLEDPFVYMVNQKLTSNYDDEEKEQLEFEPLFLGAKISSDLRKEYVQTKLQCKNSITEEILSFDLQINNILPDSYFGDIAVKTVFENGNALLEEINKNCPTAFDFVFNEHAMQHIKQISGITPKDWFVTGELAWYNKNFTELKTITTLELSNTKNVLTGYLSSLLLLASQPEEDKTLYKIFLFAGVLNNGKASANLIHDFTATPELARTILNKIYNSMFISQFNKCSPEEIVYKDIVTPKSDNPLSFLSFKKSLTDDYGNGAWQYFSKRKLFDPDLDLGYDDNNFEEEWKAAKNHQADLILYIRQHAKNTDEAGE